MQHSVCGLSGGGGQRGVILQISAIHFVACIKPISIALGGTVCCCRGSGQGTGEGNRMRPAACMFYITKHCLICITIIISLLCGVGGFGRDRNHVGLSRKGFCTPLAYILIVL